MQAPDAVGKQPIHWATLAGDIPMMEFLISQGAALEGPGLPPLHIAASWDATDPIHVLVANGASVNFPSSDIGGSTPLHLAVQQRRLRAAKLLVQYGADASKVGEGGMTAIEMAQGDETVLEVLGCLQSKPSCSRLAPKAAVKVTKMARQAGKAQQGQQDQQGQQGQQDQQGQQGQQGQQSQQGGGKGKGQRRRPEQQMTPPKHVFDPAKLVGPIGPKLGEGKDGLRCDLPRVSAKTLTMAEFDAKYRDQQAFVLVDATETWGARSGWDPKHFAEAYGNYNVSVRKTQPDVLEKLGRPVLFKEFVTDGIDGVDGIFYSKVSLFPLCSIVFVESAGHGSALSAVDGKSSLFFRISTLTCGANFVKTTCRPRFSATSRKMICSA